MIMVRAIVRPDKKEVVLDELSSAGFHAATVVDVVGRGKQKGIKFGDVIYDEIPKSLIMLVINDEDKEDVLDVIIRHAKTGDEGAFGDGKIFISSTDEVYTVSSGVAGL
ncbi:MULTISPECIES: P-II family nitrogen regulator [Pelosinus]|jgi:nitrogen regulatory protein PII 1|uniref:Nitrogen regulatory protein P-II n=1 Tax=Pelosinus fermentans B4 TaxID=1149862 RepID=I8RJ88_9FIRM|nr:MULTISPECIES: P-II family nitrogen regulator [Pelosinus]EIW20048.1 nitrogen regulatory protein P-II [Pelosinus fermentans B4]EIW26097.1 nitrogen regulatory protein P-II [Pelosinus fermentans A11]OAM93146.1 nitrogen regulatory protein P-II [Pelosinus fermentans DSM 17108]SDQ68474.1 nitrogen regulatory protein P-II family [Pelosinus fermentans]